MISYLIQGARYIDGSPVEKDLILKKVVACRDSHTQDQYNANREELMEITSGLVIRPGRVKNEVSFRSYYDLNWESIQPMWVLVYRKKLPLQVILLCTKLDVCYGIYWTHNFQINCSTFKINTFCDAIKGPFIYYVIEVGGGWWGWGAYWTEIKVHSS